MYEKIGIVGSMRVRGEYLFHHRSYLPLYLMGRGTRSSVSISHLRRGKSRSNYLAPSSVSSPPYAHRKSIKHQFLHRGKKDP
jgi:hypothetical protein